MALKEQKRRNWKRHIPDAGKEAYEAGLCVPAGRAETGVGQETAGGADSSRLRR